MIQIEKYNRFGQLIVTYPSVEVAAAENAMTVKALYGKLCCWDENSKEQYKFARQEDNALNADAIYPLVQYYNDSPVNRFRTLQEAAELLGTSKSTVDRWIRSGEEDNFGCTWKRSKT